MTRNVLTLAYCCIPGFPLHVRRLVAHRVTELAESMPPEVVTRRWVRRTAYRFALEVQDAAPTPAEPTT